MLFLKGASDGRADQAATSPSRDAVSLEERFHNGDDAALEEVWRVHFAAIHAFPRRRCLGIAGADAEQLTVDTFERPCEHRKDYDPNKPLRPWLRTIADHLAANACRSLQRRRALNQATNDDDVLANLADPNAWLDDELCDLLHEALDAIPAIYRDVLWSSVCAAGKRAPSRDLAAEGGVSAAVIDQRIHRAKTLLREELLRRGVEKFLRPVRKTPGTEYLLIEGHHEARNGDAL